jgi:hypothetical protein
MYDDAIDLPAEAKKLNNIGSRGQNVAEMLAICVLLISAGLFTAAAAPIRADRTARIPVVTWGRAAAPLALLDAISSVAGGVLALFTADRDGRWSGPQALSLYLAILGVLGFLFYLGAQYED